MESFLCMDFSMVYIVFVDLDKDGSYMTHVNGFVEGLNSCRRKVRVFGKGRNIINTKFLHFTGDLPKLLAYIILDLFSAAVILFGPKSNVYIVRPYRFTLLIYLASRLRKVTLVQENNGILHDELSRNGFKIQSAFYKYFEVLIKNIPAIHVCVSSGILNHYKALNVKGQLMLSSNGISKERIYKRISPLAFDEGLRLLFIGKLVSWQGIVQFLEYLLNSPTTSIASITVVGNGAEEDLVQSLLRKLSFETTYVGWSSWEEIQVYSENCNVGLIPRIDASISGSPLKMFDYISLGLPIISTDIDGIKDVLNKSKLYYKLRVEDKLSISQICSELKAIDEELFTKEVIDLVNKFEWGNIVHEILGEIERYRKKY